MTKSQQAELRLHLSAECDYKIRIERSSLIDRMSCVVRDRWTLIYPTSVGLLLLGIGQRVDSESKDATSLSAILVITSVLCFSLNLAVEYFVSVAILHAMAVAICCLVVFFGSVAHNIAVRFLARAITFSTTWSDWLLGGLVDQLPLVGAVLLCSVIPVTCGALAMLLSLFLRFLRLTSTYEDFLEELLLASMRRFNLLRRKDTNKETIDATRKNIIDQLVLLLFWSFAALPAVPTALVWARNYNYSVRLVTEDQVYLYSWIVLVACGASGLVRIPAATSDSYASKLLAIFLRCSGWITLAITATSNATQYYWCFPPCFAAIVLLVSINALRA